MNKLSVEKRVQVIAGLIEGCSVRSVSRMTGVAKGTILRLLADVGTTCAEYQDRALRNLTCKRVQVDEIWSFCYAKEKNVTPAMVEQRDAGDVWTFVAIDADTKLAISWLVGKRDAGTALEFTRDLEFRLRNRIQLTTDGHRMYMDAVETAFANGVDYAMLVKLYGADRDKEAIYSPARCIGVRMIDVLGTPDPKHISTSYIERQNLTMRMQMRRFTRLTNGFSKKLENHIHAIALFYMHYNFCRIHQTLRVTPAMEAGVSQHVWSIEEIIKLAEASKTKIAA